MIYLDKENRGMSTRKRNGKKKGFFFWGVCVCATYFKNRLHFPKVVAAKVCCSEDIESIMALEDEVQNIRL